MGHPQLATDTSRVRRWIDMGEIPRDPVPRVLAALFTERLGRVVTIEDLGFVRHGRAGKRRDAGSAEQSRRPAVGARADGRGPHRIHGNGPHAQPTRLGGRGRRARRRLRTQQRHARLAAHRPRPRRPTLPVSTTPCTPTPPGSTATRPPPSGRRRSRHWSARSRCSAPGTPPAAAGSSARPWWASSTRWAACSPTATPTISSGACGASPPTSPSSPAGCPTTSAWNPPPRSTSSSPPTRPARAATGPRAGEALSRAARQMVHLGRPDDALDLMKLAKSGSGEQALPRTRAMLHTIEAWAQASMGRGQAMRRTLGEAEDLFVSDKGDVPPPSWMQMFDEADLHGMQALAYRTLAEHDPAAAEHRPAPRQAGAGAARRRPAAVEDLRLHLAGLGLLHRRRPRTGRPVRPAGPGVDGARPPPTAPGTGCARCTGSPGSTPATRRSRTCARRSSWPCPKPRSKKPRSAEI